MSSVPRTDLPTARLTPRRAAAEKLLELGEDGLVGQLMLGSLGDTEVNDLGHRHSVVERDQNVGGFDVPMNDSLLVGVLDGLANLDEQPQPLLG